MGEGFAKVSFIAINDEQTKVAATTALTVWRGFGALEADVAEIREI